jgi:hypothetical protein
LLGARKTRWKLRRRCGYLPAMPRIFDNIHSKLSDGLRKVLPEARCCSFCIGYLNLRGWGQIAELEFARWVGETRGGVPSNEFDPPYKFAP